MKVEIAAAVLAAGEAGPATEMERRPKAVAVVPRLLRLRDAPRYLGMDKNRFNHEVRPWLTVIPIGIQGKAFDRLELDAWADEHKRLNGRRPSVDLERTKLWNKKDREASLSAAVSGTLTKTSSERAFARAVERAISGKPPRSSRDGLKR